MRAPQDYWGVVWQRCKHDGRRRKQPEGSRDVCERRQNHGPGQAWPSLEAREDGASILQWPQRKDEAGQNEEQNDRGLTVQQEDKWRSDDAIHKSRRVISE